MSGITKMFYAKSKLVDKLVIKLTHPFPPFLISWPKKTAPEAVFCRLRLIKKPIPDLHPSIQPLQSGAMNTKQNITLVDATGLICPVPLMLLKQAIDKLLAGDCVQIEVTDAHAELDFEIWCERFGHELIKVDVINDKLTFRITANAT